MDANTLLSLIHTDLDYFTTLKRLLGKEREVLTKRDLDAFRQLLEEKHALLRQLEANHETRKDLLKTLGLPDDGAGVDAFLAANHDASALAEWETLQRLVHECHESNEVNARITHRARATNRHLLDIVRGADAGPPL